jgi:hypothetical protein
VNRIALNEFLIRGVGYTFPQQPRALVRGMPTAHSAEPLNKIIQATDKYVWPYTKGLDRDQAIESLYPTLVAASLKDNGLYELLTLIDAIREGRVREKEMATRELEKRILNV